MILEELIYYMEITIKDLKFNKHGEEYPDGYRIVYFYDDNYSIGEYCKSIEGFMIGLVECDPIMDDDDIPEFISIDDMLDRYLKEVPNADSIGIYKTNGILIAKKERTKNNIK